MDPTVAITVDDAPDLLLVAVPTDGGAAEGLPPEVEKLLKDS
ncbi:hypothetical protein GCM10010365_12100 [Streptomyces poonensis]|uniref:Uncharacterized protein n=1 Tax=Streptomyces poonensis TaxID=68255 RepID=A0A918PAX2_9ACTN|nr:hypothetical protein GCM10010365_12100 [Streptomyces poonensis]GLJ88741.1 hypothetical protein GCM10017589_13410 [Streptomyces poonensis]